MGSEDAEMQAYYAYGKECDRLADPKGLVEFERTKEILTRRLPALGQPPGNLRDRHHDPTGSTP